MAGVIQNAFSVEVSNRPPVLVRWLPGNEQQPHADKQLNDGTPNPFPTYDINSIIYWNDDFEGGQFYYPDHGIELEIKAGMAVAHPGDVNYLHGVKPVVSGIRWTTPSFYTVTGVHRHNPNALVGAD
jgi:predicted 2-oxoglutarate/Fe(II)-dependent dioxygenase YbiX